MFKRLLFLAVLAGLAWWAWGRFSGGAPEGAPGMAAGGAPPVSVAEVVSRPVRQWQEFSGRLVAPASAEIRPRVSGVIEKIHFQEGQWVEKGAPLFTIDRRPYAAALEAAQAQATLSASELARAKTLLSEKAIPQREYDQRRSAAEAAKATLTQARLNYDYSIIEAPIAGRVSRAEVTLGNLVDAGGGAPVLTTVVSNRPIYADFDIDERTYLQYLQDAGSDPAAITAIPAQMTIGSDSRAYSGHVQSFDNQVNVSSGTVRVRTVFANEDGSLIPGLFARVRLGGAATHDALLINERAVGTDQSRKFVLVVKDDNSTERREIKLGAEAEGLRIVEEGLKPGEKIIVSGMQRVMMPGQPVMPSLVPMDAPDASPAAAPAAGSADSSQQSADGQAETPAEAQSH